jgi:hypothetical protein
VADPLATYNPTETSEQRLIHWLVNASGTVPPFPLV